MRKLQREITKTNKFVMTFFLLHELHCITKLIKSKTLSELRCLIIRFVKELQIKEAYLAFTTKV